ncbi:MAG: division/cell wall cluster transcriptional repressor MraZ [Armatimonadota bacterium]
MFGGSYTHSLDSAGRFVMPSKIRNSLGDLFYITKGVGCLFVFTREYAQIIESELNKFNTPLAALLNPEISRLTRHFFSEMVETNTDKQNRVPLTTEHRRYAGINDEVVICGCGNYVELWSPEALAEYKKNNEGVDKLVEAGKVLMPSIGQISGVSDAGLSQTSSAQ